MARQKSEIERDRKLISEQYLAGRTQSEIAAKLGLSQPTVSRDLKQIQKQWMKETTFNLDQAKGAELARIDRIENEYWKAWNSSKKLERRKLKNADGTTETVFVPTKLTNPFGHVQYLQGVHKCIDQRRALLGLDAPKREEHKYAGSQEIIVRYDRSQPIHTSPETADD